MNNPCPHCNGECCFLEKREGTTRYTQLAKHGSGVHWCKQCSDGTESKPEYDGLDNPEWDGTDLAHPAWWRGCDSGADSTIFVIHQILDDIESGKEIVGTFGSQKLNMLRDRLYRMYGK
jgi:hypothetical protein